MIIKSLKSHKHMKKRSFKVILKWRKTKFNLIKSISFNIVNNNDIKFNYKKEIISIKKESVMDFNMCNVWKERING